MGGAVFVLLGVANVLVVARAPLEVAEELVVDEICVVVEDF
jgi:hypothetical protein